MRLECLFARGAWTEAGRDALAARVESARDAVVAWLAAAGLDPAALAIADPAVAVVTPTGPPSHVDYGARRLHLLWPADRDPPLVHEWVHFFQPPPAGTPGEALLREGLATHLQSVLSGDSVFPLGRARPGVLLARWAPGWPPPRAALEVPFEDAGAPLRFRACCLGAVLVERVMENLPAGMLWRETLGRPDALERLEGALGIALEEILAPPPEPGPADPTGPPEWFEGWRSAAWGDRA